MLNIRLYQSVPYSCPYIPQKIAHHFTTEPNLGLSCDIYSHLIAQGFRRAGDRIHRPNCTDCKQCVSLRVPVSGFDANRRQRRVMNKNRHLSVRVVSSPNYLQYISLYERYIRHRHPETESMQNALETFEAFLFSTWSETFSVEFCLPSGQLACVAICDPLKHGWSAVYTFF